MVRLSGKITRDDYILKVLDTAAPPLWFEKKIGTGVHIGAVTSSTRVRIGKEIERMIV